MPLPADALVLQHPHTSPFPIHCCFLGDISSGSSSRVHHNSLPLPICSFHCSASCPKPQRQIQALGGMIVGKRETPDKHTELLQSPAGCGCCQCQGVTFALFYLIVTASNPPSAPGGDPNQRSQPEIPTTAWLLSAPAMPTHSLGRVFHPGTAVWGRGKTRCEDKWSLPFGVRGIPPQVSQVSGCLGRENLGAAELGRGQRGLSRSCAGHPTPATGHSLGVPQICIAPRPRSSSSRASPSRDRSGAPEAPVRSHGGLNGCHRSPRSVPARPPELPTPGGPAGTHQAGLGANQQVRHLRSAAPAAAPGGPCPGPPPVPPRHHRPGHCRGKGPQRGRGAARGLRRVPRYPGAAVPTRDEWEVEGDAAGGDRGQKVKSREKIDQEMMDWETKDRR